VSVLREGLGAELSRVTEGGIAPAVPDADAWAPSMVRVPTIELLEKSIFAGMPVGVEEFHLITTFVGEREAPMEEF
jgi:hypothetical protein